MKYILSLLFLLVHVSFSQDVYVLKSSQVSFFAGTVLEDIDAKNSKSISVFNAKTGDVQIQIPNKEFIFKRSLMQEHFNENYMESEKFPQSSFKGKIINLDSINLKSSDIQKVKVKGVLNIHGVAQEKTIDVNMAFNNGIYNVDSKFIILLDDYKIERPKIVWEKLAEKVEITLKLEYAPYKK